MVLNRIIASEVLWEAVVTMRDCTGVLIISTTITSSILQEVVTADLTIMAKGHMEVMVRLLIGKPIPVLSMVEEEAVAATALAVAVVAAVPIPALGLGRVHREPTFSSITSPTIWPIQI